MQFFQKWLVAVVAQPVAQQITDATCGQGGSCQSIGLIDGVGGSFVDSAFEDLDAIYADLDKVETLNLRGVKVIPLALFTWGIAIFRPYRATEEREILYSSTACDKMRLFDYTFGMWWEDYDSSYATLLTIWPLLIVMI